MHIIFLDRLGYLAQYGQCLVMKNQFRQYKNQAFQIFFIGESQFFVKEELQKFIVG